MPSQRKKFLLSQFHGMVLQATVQRAAIYRSDASDRERARFHIGLRKKLDRMARHYERSVSERDHYRRIAALSDTLSRDHAVALRGGRFRIGPAQKALNLFLKYLWCSGWIAAPPHCPFDARIIDLLPYGDRVRWTRLDRLESYKQLVASAKLVAGPSSLAEWELIAYERASALAVRGVD